MDWLASPLDITRPHDVSSLLSWHGRLMVLAWAVCIPLGIIAARFFKVMPNQNWPRELDNRTWWYGHIYLQIGGVALTVLATGLILWEVGRFSFLSSPHHFLGWLTIVLMVVQVFGGFLRGSKGGPTYPAPDGSWRGDHYDMTKRRRLFELCHKSLGNLAILTASTSVVLGLWAANGPKWMLLALIIWWTGLAFTYGTLEKYRKKISTYQAIWGPDQSLPGNKQKS